MAVMVWLLSDSPTEIEGKRRAYVSADWEGRFQPFEKDPLDLYLFNRMLQAHLDTGHRIKVANDWEDLDSLKAMKDENYTYYFIGPLGLHNDELDSLLSYVESGSELFLAYDGIEKTTDNILPKIVDKYAERSDYDDSIRVYTGKQKYDMINIHQNDTIATDWRAFGDIEVEAGFEGLSSFMEMYNYVKIPRGQGTIYLHITPALFYNYQIKRRDGFRYATKVINELPSDQDLILLEFGRLPDDYGEEDYFDEFEEEGKEDDSFLKPLFEDPYLLTALLLSLGGMILFVIFRTKRMRPIVPFVESRKDMTLAFAETITSIYFAKRNPYGILQIQKKNFYALIQKHFFIDLQRREDDKAIISLAEKSNKSVDEIKMLLRLLETKEASSVNEQFLADLDKKKRKFYKETGIISEKVFERIKEDTFVLRRSLLLPMIMILAGIILVLAGFYYLVVAVGVGITLWPVGLIVFLLGVLRLSTPLLKITEDSFIAYNAFGFKKEFKTEELMTTTQKANGVVFEFTENRKLIINFWDLSRFDRRKFEQLVTKLQMNEL